MARNVNDIIKKLSPRQRKKVEARAAQLIAEEMTLQQLRRARKLTQQKVAKSLRIGQEGVSRLEKRSDLLISTLRSYVEAMGGNLSLVAQFPDRAPVVLSGVAEEEPDQKPTGRRRLRYDGRMAVSEPGRDRRPDR
jgi:transcriptional regulator with XRE-family HTH domain